MPSYTCQYCHHDFSLKTDLDRHLKKKNACIPIAQMQQLNVHEQQQENSRNVQEVSSIFKSCLDILRNDEGHLVGDEALPELSRMIIYKQMEKLIDDRIIDLTQMKNHDAVVAKWGEKYEENISFAKFSRLFAYINERPENVLNLKKIMNEFLWKTIGSNHPKLKCIFPEDGKFTIKTPQTFKELMLTLSKIDFNNYDFDILGEAYEKLFVDAIFGAGGNKKSELGQFFTPRQVIQFMINEVELKIKENGEIESFADFSCGTGGILITAINHYRNYIQQGLITEEQLKEQFKIKLFGIEIKDKLFNLCAANILLHTGEVLENIVLGDSIRRYRNIKVDKIVMNPPFSVKIDYDSLFIQRNDNNDLHLHMNDIIPIRVGGKNSESLFLQMMIYCLNIGGKCATVMLDGQKMDNSNAGNREVREYLMKSCNLNAVIYCQGGTFTSTASKTCILVFTKKKERANVVTISGTGSKRSYEFTSTHATRIVRFFDYRPEIEGGKFLLGEVPIAKIAAKNYSLRLQDYDEEEEQEEIEGVQWMKLGDVCEIRYGTRIVKSTCESGNISVYGGGRSMFFTSDWNREGKTLVVARFALSKKCVSVIDDKFYLNDSGMSIHSKNSSLLQDYVNYFLLNNQDKIYALTRGAAQQNLDMNKFKDLQIPIPPLAMQQNFVDYCEKIETDNQQTQKMIEVLRQNNMNYLKLCKMRFKNRYQFIMKKLGEVCEFKNGQNITRERLISGEYPVVGGGKKPLGYHNEFNVDENTILISKDGAYAGYISKYPTKVFVSNHGIFISKTIQNINMQFLYNILKINLEEKFFLLQRGAAQPGIKKEEIAEIQIPIPSLEEQQRIVDFCELQQVKIKRNEELIEQLQRSIDESPDNAKMYLELMVQSFGSPEVQENIEDISHQFEEQEIEDEPIPNILEEVIEEPTRPRKAAAASAAPQRRK